MGSYTYGSMEVHLSRLVDIEETDAWLARVQGHETPRDPRTGWTSSDDFDPSGWCFDGSIDGDVGRVTLAGDLLWVEVGGKVYDVPDALAVFVRCLPPDVTAEGVGTFETESEWWGLRARGREVQEVTAEIVAGDWQEATS